MKSRATQMFPIMFGVYDMWLLVISGFRRVVNKICAFLGCNVA